MFEDFSVAVVHRLLSRGLVVIRQLVTLCTHDPLIRLLIGAFVLRLSGLTIRGHLQDLFEFQQVVHDVVGPGDVWV